jgi:hypothetical protein
MVHHLTRARTVAAIVFLAATALACGEPISPKVAGPHLTVPTAEEIPMLTEQAFGGAGAATQLGGEQLAEVAEATPPGLRITTIQIASLPKVARDSLHLNLYRVYGGGPGLITLPVSGIDPQIGMYYLIVPVINDGPAPVRNLKARADFYDANGVVVWTETQPVTHFPTRLGLNPPSLPNDPNAPAGELGTNTRGFGLYYFAGNVGIFTFAVPDASVAKTVRRWTLTFLVSTT